MARGRPRQSVAERSNGRKWSAQNIARSSIGHNRRQRAKQPNHGQNPNRPSTGSSRRVSWGEHSVHEVESFKGKNLWMDQDIKVSQQYLSTGATFPAGSYVVPSGVTQILSLRFVPAAEMVGVRPETTMFQPLALSTPKKTHAQKGTVLVYLLCCPSDVLGVSTGHERALTPVLAAVLSEARPTCSLRQLPSGAIRAFQVVVGTPGIGVQLLIHAHNMRMEYVYKVEADSREID